MGAVSATVGMPGGWAGWGWRNTARARFSTRNLKSSYADGSTQLIATDDSWKAGPGDIVGFRSAMGRSD